MSRDRKSKVDKADVSRGGFVLAAIFFVQAVILFLLDSAAWIMMAAWVVIFLVLTLPPKGPKR
jgi:hypothetical protein